MLILKCEKVSCFKAVELEKKMSVKETLEKKLKETFEPSQLEVIDQSHKHRGHVGSRPEGETHFHLNMEAKAFAGESRVSRQRMVHECLKEELKGRVHALSMSLGAEDNS